MFTWKYIDIPQEEIDAFQKEVRNKLPDNDYFFQMLDIEKKTIMGLEIDLLVLIQVEPGFGLDNFGIHKDAGSANNQCLAINIPLENCSESITKFWKTSKPEITHFTPNGIPYNFFESDGCESIDEFKLTRPVIFDTGIPHNVVNPQKVWRRAISIRFKEDPWHLVK